MSLQTLLEAAKYIELQEQLNSTSSLATSALTIRPPSLSASSTSSNSSSTSSTTDAAAAAATYHHHNHNQTHRNSFVNSSSNHNNHHHSRHHGNSNNHSTNINNNNNNNNNSSNNNVNRANNNSNSRNNHRNRQHHEQRRGNKRSASGSTLVSTSNYPSSASSSPHSPIGGVGGSAIAATSLHTSNALLTNGLSTSHQNGGLTVGLNGAVVGPPTTSVTTNGINGGGNNHILTTVQSSVVNGYDYDGRHPAAISVGNSEEPSRIGDSAKISPPPPPLPTPLSVPSSSYLLISANNENGIEGMVSTISPPKPYDATVKVVNGNIGSKVDISNNNISNKCIPYDSLAMSKPSLSPIALNAAAAYPTSSTANSKQQLTTSTIPQSSRSPVFPYSPPPQPPSKIKKFTPLTPPPTSSRKLVEITRTRSSSLSSNNFTANVVNGSSTTSSATVATSVVGPSNGGLSAVVAAAASMSASEAAVVASLHSTKIVTNGVTSNSGTEDSSQSSLNLSSSGYHSGSSGNSSVGVSSTSCNHNTSNNSSPSSSLSSVTSVTAVGLNGLNGSLTGENALLSGQMSIPTSGRRRTTSTNSTGAGTREVHNKLEKHRRAHLKECFEQLKKQLDLRDEERKKTSNLAILGAAYRCVMYLKRNERELEQQVEKLAKEKINYQKRILSLKRELASKHDNFDISSILPDTDIRERDSPSGSATRYSSSSSLSSGTTVPSPAGSGSGSVPHAMLKRETSPQVVMSNSLLHTTTPHSPSNHHYNNNNHHMHHSQFPKSISPVTAIGNSVPLSLTTKSLTRGSPTPSTPSPSSSSMNGIPPSSPIISSSGSPSSHSSSSPTSSLSASPPISIPQSSLGSFAMSSSTLSSASVPISLKIQNVPNGLKVSAPGSIISSSASTAISSSSASTHQQHIPPSSSPLSTSNLAIISSSAHNSSGLSSVASTASALSAATVFNYTTTSETSSNSILAPAHLSSTATINSLPLNLNAPANLTILHAGKNGVCRKSNDLIVTTQQQPLQSHHSSLSVTSASVSSKDKLLDNGSDQTTTTTKCINLVPNGIIAQQLDQVSLPQGLVWAIGPMSQPPRAATSRLLVSTTPQNGRTTSETAILPGGAEVNVLPQSGNVAIVNNGIAFKGADGVGANGHAVHVMTPIQPRLQSLVVPQGLISSQLSGNVLSVSRGQLPIQYLNGMEQMVVVANNPTTSTLSSVPNTATSVALATATAANGSIS